MATATESSSELLKRVARNLATVESIDGQDYIVSAMPVRDTLKLSESGKTFTVSTTGGLRETGSQFAGKDLKFSATASVKNPEFVKK